MAPILDYGSETWAVEQLYKINNVRNRATYDISLALIDCRQIGLYMVNTEDLLVKSDMLKCSGCEINLNRYKTIFGGIKHFVNVIVLD